MTRVETQDLQALKKLGALAEVGWLSEQPADFQALIASAGRWTTFPRQALLYAEGDESTAIFGLGEGMLDVSIPVSVDEEVVIYRAPPGFWIGDSGVLACSTRTLSLRAAVESRVFRISAAALLRILEEQPASWTCFARLSHHNGTLAIQVLAEVLGLPPRVRFARMLLRMASADGMVRATQEELGRMAGMSRPAFRRSFGDLIATGVVATTYGGVQIVDLEALHAVALAVAGDA